MMEKVGGKSIPALVAEGRGKFASMPAGGAAAPASAAKAAPVAAKVEEKPKEEEVDVDMGDLFGY